MFVLGRVRTHEVYRNCLKSVLKYDTVQKCLMSSNSDETSDILHLLKKKNHPEEEKKKIRAKTANELFDLMTGDVNKKAEPQEKEKTVEEEPKTDLAERLNELIKKAEAIPTSLNRDPVVSIAKKHEKYKKEHSDSHENDEKRQLFYSAKQVALSMGVSVEETEKELIEAYESIKGEALFQRRKGERSERSPNLRQFAGKQTKSHTQHLNFIRETTPLNIFEKNVGETETQPILETWNTLKKIALLQSSFRPPKNYFEEQITWTNLGKIWRFPIDNDQDWHEEIATDFTDHVFLEKHLEPWCPKSGPIRHFMELVTTGLSKNPYLSAEKKKNHILWYKDYFQAKSKLLAELGLMDSKENADVPALEARESKS